MIFLKYHNYPVKSNHVSWLLNTLSKRVTLVCADF